jgi:hypothetical protein
LRHLLSCALALFALCGCSRNSKDAVPQIEATPSTSGTVVARQGAARSMTVTFTAPDDQPIFDFTVELDDLPATWSGPGSFGCAKLDAGHPCVLTLTYSPLAVGSGALSLAYEYSYGRSRREGNGSISLPFAATSNNNVNASMAPAGPVYARIGAGTRSVAVTFVTDDGLPASALVLRAGSSALPAGWSGEASGFGCAEVGTGSGCTLVLQYVPIAVDNGVFTLEYDYLDNSGVAKSGSANVVYAATANNNIAGTASPTGQINAVIGSGVQPVQLTFTTDDGNSATDFAVTSDLGSLPAGWSSAAGTLTCSTVSTGNGCQLSLSYAPLSVGGGVLTLAFDYVDNSGASKSGSVDLAYASTSNNNVAASAAPSGQVNAVVGTGTQPVAVTFTTDDGNAATALALTTDLGALPAGWSSTAGNFSCAAVGTGNGCQLPLSYAPTAVGSGTLALGYTYVDNSGAAKTGSINLAYASTSNNNLVATAAPAGQINAVVSAGTQQVAVTFTTDDGNAATGIALTSDLTALPAGWSSIGNNFSCANASSGNGCQLTLAYTPTTVGSGTLTLSYSYVGNSGAARTGSINLPYASTSNNNVVATAAPSGQINAVVGAGSQSASVTFTTDDGNPATSLLVTTDLTSLPAGWSSTANNFDCSSVSTGNGCQLPLSYAPVAVGSGSLSLSYSYVGNSGAARTGTINLPYASTSHNNVTATAAPSGQVNAVIGAGTQAVAVTFTTDDGNVASAFAMTTDLTTLPAGWSSTASNFTCAAVSTGNGCQLPLSYSPSGVGSGNVVLQFGYSDNSGASKTGSLTIPFASTANNNVSGTVTPSGQINAVAGAGAQTVTVVFATDDGNTASGLSISSGLLALPAGWSHATGSFACASVAGPACELTLQYAPSVAASGTLTLGFGYTNNAGISKAGTVAIDYAASAPVVRAYVAQLTGTLAACPLAIDGTLASCVATGGGYAAPTGIAFAGDHAYVSDYYDNLVWKCDVSAAGALSACVSTGSTFLYPMQLDVKDGWLYVANAINFGGISSCAIGVDGSLSGCTRTAGSGLIALEITGDFLYTGNGNNLQVCSVAAGGPPTGCVWTGSGFNSIWGVGLDAGFAYIGNQGSGNVTVCARNPVDGTLSACSNYAVGGGPTDVVIRGSRAYVADLYGDLRVCDIGAGNGLFNCASSTGGTSMSFVLQIAIR